MLASGWLFAQSASQSDLELCASLETAALKLACFEALTARYSQAPAVETSPDPAVTPAPEIADAVDELAAEPGIPASATTTPQPESAEPVSAPVPADSVPVAVAGQSDSTVHSEAQPGAKPEDSNRFTATVVRVSTDRRLRRHTFEMENGEVWRQVESDRLHFPKDRPFDVEVRRGLMGDYQMRIGGKGRMTRIRKLR